MKNLYDNQTKESYWIPNEKEIEKYIISFYEEKGKTDEKIFLQKFFENCSLSNEIIKLIIKNDELALNNANSNKSPEEKEKGKINIINDINFSIFV